MSSCAPVLLCSFSLPHFRHYLAMNPLSIAASVSSLLVIAARIVKSISDVR
jgi:hypothetical protein